MVWATVGGSTMIVWKRRSRAASFSMNFRYSFIVVAPTHWSSPRERAGLRMFEASIAPSAAPAPTIVWSSSMNRTTFPALRISSINALMRSSNWPRYLVPATISARSRVMSSLSRRISGTSPATIRWASPSTMAVFPTPASPSSTGLFLRRRQSTWMTRSISTARPMIGSSFPRRASSVRFLPNAFRAGYFARAAGGRWRSSSWEGPSSSPGGGPIADWSSRRTSCRVFSASTFKARRIFAASPSPSCRRPSRRCSVPMYVWLRFRASSTASSMTFLARAVSGMSPITLASGPVPTAFSTSSRMVSKSSPCPRNTFTATPCPRRMRPSRRCSVPM